MQSRNSVIGFEAKVSLDRNKNRNVLITGANSYIGEAFQNYAKMHYADNFKIHTLDMRNENWCTVDFSLYDVILHVAGIAHMKANERDHAIREKYYKVNTALAIKAAKKAKEEGVKHFVFMSSMSVYGDSAPYGGRKMITEETEPRPVSIYGKSKWLGDQGIRALADKNFKVSVLRPPMIYGNGCKGNYQLLSGMAKILPVFPDVNNEKSMLYIDNLSEFLCQCMLVSTESLSENGNIFFPQNLQYVNTSEMVRKINRLSGKNIRVTKLLNPGIWLGSKLPGRAGQTINKAFGSITYDLQLSIYDGLVYQKISDHRSLILSEKKLKDREYYG